MVHSAEAVQGSSKGPHQQLPALLGWDMAIELLESHSLQLHCSPLALTLLKPVIVHTYQV